MSKWIKISDRLPTEGDSNVFGEVVIQYSNFDYDCILFEVADYERYKDCYWLEGVPSLQEALEEMDSE